MSLIQCTCSFPATSALSRRTLAAIPHQRPAIRQPYPAPQLGGAPCSGSSSSGSSGSSGSHSSSPNGLLLRPRQSHVARIWPFDQAWGTQIDGQSLASQFFAMSLLPYLGFLFFLTRSGKAPRLTLFGFYFLLAFVGATIPAGIYAKTHYGTSLANVDWLHGSAESLLTVTNLLIVLGLQQAIAAEQAKKASAAAAAAAEQQQQSGAESTAQAVPSKTGNS